MEIMAMSCLMAFITARSMYVSGVKCFNPLKISG